MVRGALRRPVLLLLLLHSQRARPLSGLAASQAKRTTRSWPHSACRRHIHNWLIVYAAKNPREAVAEPSSSAEAAMRRPP